MHTEKYSSSDVGNSHHGIREAQHAYSNSTSGVEPWKMDGSGHLKLVSFLGPQMVVKSKGNGTTYFRKFQVGEIL